jgi:catechol 2,3-dioxygenase-like lactoylglutathione lyase family enzyme
LKFQKENIFMSNHISTGFVHHLTLTVTDLGRSVEFYTSLLGFQVAAELSPTRFLLSNGSALIAITLPPDPARAVSDDEFNENRVGLDHVSFNVGSRAELDHAIEVFDQHNVYHGEVKDLGEGIGICVLAFRDPDNIQIELTAPRE